MTEQDKIRAALGKLTGILAGIALTADEKNRERCPYKTVEMHCTHAGGCQNQVRQTPAITCGGDESVQWTPRTSG